MKFELCTDSLEGVLAAENYGVDRIELCSALSIGGLTPSFGLMKQCSDRTNLEIHVMIRHRGGGFYYNTEDIDLMKLDIWAAKEAGVHGVVFGILNGSDEISDLNIELLEYSKSLNLEATFHRAFDFVHDYKKAISTIIDIGFDRLLTSGLQATAELGLEVIADLNKNFGEKIEIMAGSGVNPSNSLKIAASGINNLHFTAKKVIGQSFSLGMGDAEVVDEEKIRKITELFKR